MIKAAGTPWSRAALTSWIAPASAKDAYSGRPHRGQLARRDVEVHHEPEAWAVEARQVGQKAKRWRAANETDAKNIADQLMLP